MLKRKIETYLADWKRSEDRKPLVIKGIRQCGKTYSVLDFAHKNYEYVSISTSSNTRNTRLFLGVVVDIDILCMTLSALIPDCNFVPGKTCIIFDEIQECHVRALP